MAISITTNVSSLLAQNNLNQTNNALNRSISKLSSGSRIVSAQDDPAGMAISEKLRGQIRGTNVNRRNAEDGISLLQVAEGGMTEVGNILIRMKELSLQASNETLSTNDRSFLNTEFQQLKNEIQRVADSTKFNGLGLLSGGYSQGGTYGGLTLQVGLTQNSADLMTVFISSAAPAALGSTGTGSINAITIAQSAGRARDVLKYIEAALNDISQARSQVGSQLSRLSSTVRNLSTTEMNLAQANSRIKDVDVASETAELSKNQILMQAGVSVLAQANSSSQIALSLL